MPAALPPDPHAVVREERALRDQRRWAEAEAMLAAAVAAWPDDETLLVDYGLLAHQQMHWEDMAARFAVVRERCPGHPFGYSRGGEALLWMGQVEAAESVLAAGVRQFPDHPEVRVQWVLAACGRQDWAEAWRRAEQMMALLPDVAESYRFASEVPLRAGKVLEAETVIGEGMQRLGPVPVLSRRFAELAALREDWPAARRRWGAVLKHAPDDADARRQQAEAAKRAGQPAPPVAAVPVAVAAPSPVPVAPVPVAPLPGASAPVSPMPVSPVRATGAPAAVPEDVRTLLLDFEPLGQDPEFGIVQRHIGLEPLALLRDATIPLDGLIAALDGDMAGIGAASQTRLRLGPGNEFLIDDTRYGLVVHTRTGPERTSAEALLPGAQRRLAFLARKLLDDLREPSRILLRSCDPPESPERLLALHRALRRLGNATLLAVEASADPARIGRAQWLAPGVMRGWVERFSLSEPRLDQWIAVCRSAHALWVGGPPPDRVAAPEQQPMVTTTLLQPIAIAPALSFGTLPT